MAAYRRIPQWLRRARDSHLFQRNTLGRQTFRFAGGRYEYFCHPYNTTWRNERAVEVPIALRALHGVDPAETLEVGNVLRHYGALQHQVVDKYEPDPAIENADIVDFDPGRQFSLVVSISTLEHVGWDEAPRDPPKVLRAFERLDTLLAPGGLLLVTLPVGYNPHLDRYLREGQVRFDEMRYIERVSARNLWVERNVSAAWERAYGAPYEAANGLLIGWRRKPVEG